MPADDAGGAWPVTTWQGWQHFATTPPPQPPASGEPERSVEERLAYHSAFVTVRTPAIDTLTTNVRTLMILGRHQQTTARPSLIVTGPAAAGKTTALLHVGRACHLAHTHSQPAPAGTTHAAVPVAYVLVPPGATAKGLAAEFARYLGIPVTARMTQAQITDAVCHTYNHACVRLVLIDEIHRLNPRTTTGAETTDLLKDLTERIGATFVYAGIDVTTTALFSGVRGAQLAGRASLVECGAFPARHGTREPFRELIAGVETALDLRAHRAGTLPRHTAYLHQRTAGRIGSLTQLIRQAAITSILDGSERITKQSLEQVRIDHLAETHHRPAMNGSRAPRRLPLFFSAQRSTQKAVTRENTPGP
ncbi:TniB family NTP-binding protein [Streptomyces sp. NBC_01363]|uniref:TniB family NTP-binding protein n=1 Tax=Streptomyces sp. NBC_01363 TaxID=2903840 RepID=UPI00224F8D50|nr:TniB family NTP-binding protein [Streptomyces sp. NBC_01363]MCX4734514.1 TniB family NTP-binding protein [Streptomyces sp. NBC_01363]